MRCGEPATTRLGPTATSRALNARMARTLHNAATWRSGLDQVMTNRVTHEPGGVVDRQLAHDVLPVGFGGLEADGERGGDLAGGLALGDELQHLALARRE